MSDFLTFRHSLVGIAVADVAIVDLHESSAIDSATFTAAIDVTGDGRNAVDVARAVHITDDDVAGAEVITCRVVFDASHMVAHGTTPATTIDIADGTTLDIGSGRGLETVNIFVSIVTGTKFILETAIDLYTDRGD